MEDKINKLDLVEQFKKVIIEKKILFIVILSIISILILGLFSFNIYQKNINKKISEKFINAGLYLALENKEESKKLYKEVVLNKHKFYSPLALSSIIENNLEKNTDDVLNLFTVLDDIKINKEEKNLIKLKKALYIKKFLNNSTEAKKELNKIIASDSIWKDIATELSN